MKVGFIGLGRMGQVMAQRILEAKHDLGVYNRTAERPSRSPTLGAKVLGSIKEAATYGEGVFTMLADDAAVEAGCDAERRAAAIAAQGRHPCLRRHAFGRLHSEAQDSCMPTPVRC